MSFTDNILPTQTPPRRQQRFSTRESSGEGLQAGLSPTPSSKSTTDSGVEDLFDSPQKPTVMGESHKKPLHKKPEVEDVGIDVHEEHDHVVSKNPENSLDENGVAKELMPEDPFASEQSRILFEAIDELQACGSNEFLDIPQLVIVGGQSTGKSALLQTLTDIPFPVGNGCCTRFPTRIISRRTAPGTADKFRISIEKIEERVEGELEEGSEGLNPYNYEGKSLSTERFVEVVDEISSKYMGLRKGKGPDKKNFTEDVLKIELWGPNRSYFSILDLPGIFHHATKVNDWDRVDVKKMIVDYMKKPENIVICVANAMTDFNGQKILKMASVNVDKHRLVGVITKCDRVELESSLAREIVSIASGSDEDHAILKDAFLVRNRTEDDSASMDIQSVEDQIFSRSPWTSVSRDRLGSAALKAHLGYLLSAKIRSSFPSLQAEIRSKLRRSLAESERLGQPRNDHTARRQYLVDLVKPYERKALLALNRPGFLKSESPAMELRNEISRLNKEFDSFMRTRGGFWEFEENLADPLEILKQLNSGTTDNPPVKEEVQGRNGKPHASLEEAFPDCSQVAHSENMRKVIKEELEEFKGNQLPGIINPDVYPTIYRKQVEKWTKITEIHLLRVKSAVKKCFEALLKSICPPKGGTAAIHQRLLERLMAKFEETYQKAYDKCMEECRRETECQMPLTTDPRFERELHDWRRLRFTRGAVNAFKKDWLFNNLDFYFNCMHTTVEENLINDVHDVVKVYYKLSLENFIRDITKKYIEDFVSHEHGPIRGLNTDYIFTLSEEEVEKLAREDEITLRRRRELNEEIKKLQHADNIARRAAERTEHLATA